jgi:hypothetical protein
MTIVQGLGQEKEPDGIMFMLMKANRIIHSELDLKLHQEILSQILLCAMVVHHNKK